MFIWSVFLFVGACDLRAEDQPPPSVSRAPLLARLAAQPLIYTKHARCRMGCRHVSEAEVVALLSNGKENPRKSREGEAGQCPSYAIEGRSTDGQELRIVYAGCEHTTKVVTTIDLGQDWPCDCY